MSENKRAGNARPKSSKKTSRSKKSEAPREAIEHDETEDFREEDTAQAASPDRGAEGDYEIDDRDREDDRDERDDDTHRDDDRKSLPDRDHPEGDAPRVSYKPSDFYLSQVYFDRGQNQFVAHVLEFPEVKVVAGTKEQAYKDLERKLEGHLASLRNRGEQVPDAAHVKHYPEKLEVPISQNLYRRLDILSRQEKQSLESLVTELLTHAMDKRHGGRSGGHQAQSHGERHERHERGHGRDRDRDRGGNRDRREDRDNRGNRHQNNRGGQQRRPQGRGYHESLENRENFLEYVRNLEKSGGGAGGGWRKK